MNTKFQAPKGTQDILPNQTEIWQKIELIAHKICKNFNFNEIRIPTFENENLFNHSVGSSTDVVKKEMFKFTDLAGRPLALRPEGTACVARAILEHGLMNEPMPLKFFYLINCFRNERPQAGRFKEFHQFGLELFGSTSTLTEIEIITLINQFFNKLKIKNLNLKINSIGCTQCRKIYKQKLIKFFQDKTKHLCNNCITRLKKNPLRILDCKNTQCCHITQNAPKIVDDMLCTECEKHFEQVCNMLTYLNINFKIDPLIVRGLDYYNRTVFEFQSNELGAQSTICGGGRYDSLIETISTKNSLPAVGCAVGLERLIMLLQAQNNPITQITNLCCLFIGNFDTTTQISMSLTLKLRNLNLNAECNLINRSVKAQIKYASKINAQFACIIGENEINKDSVQIKNMTSKQTYELKLTNFVNEFITILKNTKITLP